MQEIKLEVNGRIQTATVEQLRTLALKNFVKADARIWIDGVECRVGDVHAQLQSGASTLQAPGTSPVPMNAGAALPSAGGPKTNPPRRPNPAPTNGAAGQGWNASGMIDLNALQVPVHSPAPNRLPLILAIIGGVLALIAIVGFVAFKVGARQTAGNPDVEVAAHADEDAGEKTDDGDSQDAEDASADAAQDKAESSEKEDSELPQSEKSEDANDEKKESETTSESSSVAEEENSKTEADVELPFDPACVVLPKDFKGNDFSKIFSGVRHVESEIEQAFDKEEFETTEEYKRRVANSILQSSELPVSGKVCFNSYVAIVMPNENGSNKASIRSKYDADNNLLTVNFQLADSIFEGSVYRYARANGKRKYDSRTALFDYHAYPMNDISGKREDYEAHNAFNATVTVHKSSHTLHAFYIKGKSKDRYSYSPEIKIKNVPVDFAKKISSSLNGLFVCKLVYAPIAYASSHYKATMDSPYEIDNSKYAICCEDAEFWLYDGNSGEILTKMTLDEVYGNTTKNFGNLNLWSTTAGSGDSNPSAKPSRLVRKFSNAPFNTALTKIPSEYWGHDPEEIDKALKNKVFATNSNGVATYSKEYSERVVRQAKSSLERPLYGSLKFGSRLAYVIPNEADGVGRNYETVVCDYQAASKTMTVRKSTMFPPIPSTVCPGTYPPLAVYFSLSKNGGSIDDDSRHSANGLLSRSDPLDLSGHTYALELSFKQIKKRGSSNYHIWTLSDVDEKDYRSFKDSIRVLCLYNLGYGGNNRLGVFDPEEMLSVVDPRSKGDSYPYSLICAAAPEFWIYDSRTGTILAKFSGPDTFNSIRKKIGQVEEGSVVSADSIEGGNDLESEVNDGSMFSGASTWEGVLESIVDEPQSWETKKPKIVVPDDYPSLEEAIAHSEKGDVIRIRKGASVRLRTRDLARGEKPELKIDHAVAIVGETDEPEDSVIELTPSDSISVDSPDKVAFRGVTFKTGVAAANEDYTAQVYVADETSAIFKHCAFIGDLVGESSTGVYVDGAEASATFWRCYFSAFGREGVRMRNGASGKAIYCEFFGKNRYGVSSLDNASIEIEKCRFNENITGIQASGGGSYSVTDSFFSKNRSEWTASIGSSKECVCEGNVIEK